VKSRGSALVVRALEDEGARFTFGIPGTHNIELYDQLSESATVSPILVTDEQSASFMADAVSRTSNSVGVVNVVPGAGVTHCLSGVAEAYMDCVPLVVLTCGVRADTTRAYQLHGVDQLAILAPVCKATVRPSGPAEVYACVRRAFAIARSGCPGPVAVEVPANFYMKTEEYPEPANAAREADGPGRAELPPPVRAGDVDAAARMLEASRHPALYVGNGARAASGRVRQVAEALAAPVTTTIQGKGVFPEDHPLWLWNGFGASAPPFVGAVMDRCDCLLAVGCRFGEVATASYGLTPPADLIHVDIDPAVLGRNYPARLAIAADASDFLDELAQRLPGRHDATHMVSGHSGRLRRAVSASRNETWSQPAVLSSRSRAGS
jgi:acetolactate synthase-1/2/3 large subunit